MEMEHMLGISTCWWHNRTERGDEIMGDILKLGLNGVELEYRITDYMYQQMRPQLKRDLKVLSIHNFFPKLSLGTFRVSFTKSSGFVSPTTPLILALGV